METNTVTNRIKDINISLPRYLITEGEYIRISGSQIERQGQGTQELTSGITYTGVWVSDKMNGKGVCLKSQRGLSSY